MPGKWVRGARRLSELLRIFAADELSFAGMVIEMSAR
jgi:hypothetical protein